MKILAVGDIVGGSGLTKLKLELPKIKKEKNIDFVIVNGENVAQGMGITEKDFKAMLECGANVVTLGNHTWAKKDVFGFINNENLIRPANYPKGVPGNGYGIFKCNDKKICVISLIGRTNINILTENPFLEADKIIEKVKNEVDYIILDFHAEATAEKVAMGYYLDGRANIVFGTHTHIQTADERILPKGTAYITDIGMTGPKESVIGMEIKASLKRFITTLPERYKLAESECIFNGCIFEINETNSRIVGVDRIKI